MLRPCPLARRLLAVVAFGLNLVHLAEQVRLVARQEFVEFALGPGVVVPFAFRGVGVERAGERAVGGAHLAQHPVQRAHGDVGVKLVACERVGVRIRPAELRVVVEHLLEVGQQPAFVGRVAVEAAADVVEDSALRHRGQGHQREGCAFGVVPLRAERQQHGQRGAGREFGRAAEPAVEGVEAFQHLRFVGAEDAGTALAS
jgi:hypothetical protein